MNNQKVVKTIKVSQLLEKTSHLESSIDCEHYYLTDCDGYMLIDKFGDDVVCFTSGDVEVEVVDLGDDLEGVLIEGNTYFPYISHLVKL